MFLDGTSTDVTAALPRHVYCRFAQLKPIIRFGPDFLCEFTAPDAHFQYAVLCGDVSRRKFILLLLGKVVPIKPLKRFVKSRISNESWSIESDVTSALGSKVDHREILIAQVDPEKLAV